MPYHRRITMVEGAQGVLVSWVIYERPADHPGHFVVRRQVMNRDGKVLTDGEFKLAVDLDEARRLVPDGLHRFERRPDDQRKIAEVWV